MKVAALFQELNGFTLLFDDGHKSKFKDIVFMDLDLNKKNIYFDEKGSGPSGPYLWSLTEDFYTKEIDIDI